MGVLGLWARSERRLHPVWPLGILLLLAAVAVASSAILGFVSVTRIDSVCLFCMASYAINVGLLVIALVAWRRTRVRLIDLVRSDVRGLAGWPALSVISLAAGAATLATLCAFVPSYWRAPGWSDLPRLVSGQDDQGHHWIGARSARLTVVEFSDYECPHCRTAHKAMRTFAAKHPDQIRLVHRHLPLDMACHPGIRRPFHARACLFAEAAECAGLQGRFWEMNDALFSIQETVQTEDVDAVALAVRLGLNRSDFKRCLESHATAGRIAADVEEGMARDLGGTPSFLIGERLFLGRIPEEELVELLEAAR
jgi:protein-disulfide isomerase